MFDAFASPLKKCGTMKMSSPVVALDLLVGLRDDPPLLPCAEADTGGKDQNTQWVHGEFIVSSETIRPPHTQWVHGEFF